jgi:subtilisin-like proprotein convertase family protein
MKGNWLVTAYLVSTIFLMCSDRSDDWDIYEEMNTDMVISDLSIAGIGANVVSAPGNAIVDSLRIELNITHEDYTNLDIKLIHDADSFLVWDNNYPGGIYEQPVGHFDGATANGYWGIAICDSVPDGKEGQLKKFTLTINYR